MIHEQTLDSASSLHLLQSLRDHPGYHLFLERLREAEQKSLGELRHVPALDLGFVQGMTAGLRAAQLIVDGMILEIQQESDRKRQVEDEKLRQQYIERSETPYG